MITTTLNAIRAHSPCASGWTKLLAYLGKTSADDEPLPLLTVLESNGLDDALWCLRVLGPKHYGWAREYAVWCARQVQHLMTDSRSLAALDVAERYARGEATKEERTAARSAAWAAESAARSAAESAAWAAESAAWAARSAAESAAWAAAESAAWAAARSTQANRLREVLT